MDSSDFVKDGWQAGLWRVTSCTASFTGGTAGSVSDGVVTIGSANTRIDVANAFSAKYETYRIIINGGVGSTGLLIGLQLGASVTGYFCAYSTVNIATSAATIVVDNNAVSWTRPGLATTGGISFDVTLRNASTAAQTYISGAVGRAQNDNVYTFTGGHSPATAFTGFSLICGSGNLTGGKIRVYGYNL
jgi:hypothetical protein